LETWNSSLAILAQSFDSVRPDGNNQTARDLMGKSLGTAESMPIQTMFDSLAISVPKDGSKKDAGVKGRSFDKYDLLQRYEHRFELVFDYVFLSVSPPSLLVPFLLFSHSHTHLILASSPRTQVNTTQAGLAITFMAIIAFVSLPHKERNWREYIRLSFHTFCGFAICLICLINTNKPS
jgi:hypothetical protein